jgi:asparagine synthase (glutamine-hydrolysing)
VPGIAGYVDFGNRVERDLLSLMVSAITHSSSNVVETYENAPLSIGRSDWRFFNPEPQPVVEGDLVVFFEGNITNKEELEESDTKNRRSNAQIIAQLFSENDTHFVNKVKGHFITFIWDSKKKRLLIINDRFGRYPLYYAKIEEDSFFFGSELKAFLPCRMIRREINDQAIVDFIKFRFLIGDETYFKNISLLPYASILKFERGFLNIEQYWDLDLSSPERNRSLTQCSSELEKLIEQAVNRAVDTKRGKIGIMLSGGLDSRNVAIHVPKIKGQIHTFTFGEKESWDVKVAKNVSDELGLDHHFIPLTSRFVRELSEKTVFLLEGMTYVYTGWNVNAALYVEREKIDLLLEGTCGNPILGAHAYGSPFKQTLYVLPLIGKLMTHKLYTTLPNDQLLPKVYRQLYDELGYEELPLEELLSKEYYNKVKNLIGKSLEEALHKGSRRHRLPSNLIDYFNFTERLRRWLITARDSFRWKVETVDPFLDYDLVDFMCKIPIELKLRRRLYRESLRKYHPELSNVPTEGNLANVILRAIAQQIGIARLFPQINYEGKFLNTCLRLERDFVEKILLDEKTLTRGIFDPEAIKKILSDHMSRKKDYSLTIGKLISLELWFRLFIDDQAPKKNINRDVEDTTPDPK